MESSWQHFQLRSATENESSSLTALLVPMHALECCLNNDLEFPNEKRLLRASPMPKTYQENGLNILFPDNWKLDDDQDSQTVTFESPVG
ncbi:MAG: hypothetical protein AAGG44_16680, partial [Planctomycetota bacterium]